MLRALQTHLRRTTTKRKRKVASHADIKASETTPGLEMANYLCERLVLNGSHFCGAALLSKQPGSPTQWHKLIKALSSRHLYSCASAMPLGRLVDASRYLTWQAREESSLYRPRGMMGCCTRLKPVGTPALQLHAKEQTPTIRSATAFMHYTVFRVPQLFLA